MCTIFRIDLFWYLTIGISLFLAYNFMSDRNFYRLHSHACLPK